MGRRRLYREIEAAAIRGVSFPDVYPHTRLSEECRNSLMERRDLRLFASVRCVSKAALYSHRAYDPSSVQKAVDEAFSMVVSTVPYIGYGEGRSKERDREMAVELFNEVSGEMERIVARLAGSGKVDIESQ